MIYHELYHPNTDNVTFVSLICCHKHLVYKELPFTVKYTLNYKYDHVRIVHFITKL